MSVRPRSVAVIGAGWAGCAAAVELAARGHRVHLVEAARSLGGRARGLRVHPAAGDHVDAETRDAWSDRLDNGQHILLGAYTDTLRLMRTVGVDPDTCFLRVPMQMRYPAGSGGMDFKAARLPAPLHLLVALLRATGLNRADKVSLARFTTTARWIDWQLHQDCSVAELLDRFDQTDRLIALLWRPLCIAALNTPPATASAQVFLNVLRDSLGGRRGASDMLVPRVDLGALFPVPAARFVEQRGGAVHLGMRVTALENTGERWRVGTAAGRFQTTDRDDTGFDAVILATPWTETARLLAAWDPLVAALPFEAEPITTCYLQYAPALALPQPFMALLDDAASGQWGQFVFDRGQLDAAQAGLLAVVVSASTDAVALPHDVLAAAIAEQLATVFRMPALRTPQRMRIISEKRATFSCTPGLIRPDTATASGGLFLAGDHVKSDYPATLEAAVRSGIAAARMVDQERT